MKIGIAMAIGAIAGGCAAGNASTAASYEAQQLACIDHATTREAADNCRCQIKEAFGRACDLPRIDGGAK